MFEILILSFSFLTVVLLVFSISQIVTASTPKNLLNTLSYQLSKLKIKGHRGKIRRELLSAGVSDKLSPDTFLSLQILCGVIFFLFANLLLREISICPFIAACIAFFIPAMWLKNKLTKRHLTIRRELPYFLDLFLLSVQAGLDFNTSLDCILEKVRGSALHEEFSLMQREIKMGKTRRQAMEDMRKRVNLQELSSLIGALIQADTFGVGLGKILRIQSDDLRRKRLDRAEKLAMQAPVKMLFPLIGFIFPACFIILLGPILLQLLSGGM